MLANIKIDQKKFILVQLILILIGFVITLSFYDYLYAASFLMGALVMFFANFIFFFRMFVNKQFSPTTELLIFYMSEFLKLFIVAAVTIVLAIYIKPKLFPYIFGLILLQLLVCFVPILLKKVR
ncbi:ATP synthase subunit I [Francisellaceae bacterium CB299]|jgi:F0F1-type ATP synthase assembly protein I